jgi:hypothetical protein
MTASAARMAAAVTFCQPVRNAAFSPSGVRDQAIRTRVRMAVTVSIPSMLHVFGVACWLVLVPLDVVVVVDVPVNDVG